MSSYESSQSEEVCVSIDELISLDELISSDESSWSQEVVGWSGSQWALIRASDSKKFVFWLGSQ